jgi:hypothetical protein
MLESFSRATPQFQVRNLDSNYQELVFFYKENVDRLQLERYISIELWGSTPQIPKGPNFLKWQHFFLYNSPLICVMNLIECDMT